LELTAVSLERCAVDDRSSKRAIYDNSPERADAKLWARVESGQLRKVYGSLPDWISEAISELPRHPLFVTP
jgi:hypothetical protein